VSVLADIAADGKVPAASRIRAAEILLRHATLKPDSPRGERNARAS
jgi:hypothetical protein